MSRSVAERLVFDGEYLWSHGMEQSQQVLSSDLANFEW